jgi:hypothetical protein
MIGGRPADEPVATRDSLDKADLREAYEHGRRDERARRKRHPLGMTFTFALALFGVVIVVLAIANGSFGAAGDQVDHGLMIAREQAAPVASQAADNASQKLRNAAGANS